jgi:hypothetical protein
MPRLPWLLPEALLGASEFETTRPLATSRRESQAWSGGADVDVAAHNEWRDILRAGGDAGELGTMAQTAYQLVGALAVVGFRVPETCCA